VTEFLVSTLRAIADQMAVAPLTTAARVPGVQNVYRLTIRYHDRRCRDSVATILQSRTMGITMQIAYRGLDHDRAFQHTVTPQAYTSFHALAQRIGFDKLPDQPDITAHGLDLWLLERASVMFYKSVIFSPDEAEGTYLRLVDGLRAHLPEALRHITLR
jgi:hypothetical protein